MQSVNWRATFCGAFRSTVVVALLFGAAAASATVVAPGQPPNKGTLFLETSRYGKPQFRFDPADQTDDVLQLIIDKSLVTWKLTDLCSVYLNPAANLVTMSGSAGFIGDHIGVKGSGLCSEISGSESLTISLSGLLTGLQVYHTELNLEMHSKAAARIDVSANGQTQTFVIKSAGSSVAASAIPPGATVVACTFESGIDEKDICRWASDALWSSMTIKALAGQVIVDAGTGGAPSQFSVTKISGTLDCDAARDTITATDAATGAVASGTRLQNAIPSDCKAIPYALTWSTDPDTGAPVLEYFKDDLGQSVVTTFTIQWPNEAIPPAGPSGVFGAIPLSQQEFLAAEGLKPIDLCVGSPQYALVEGELVLTSLTPPAGGFPDLSGLGGTQYGCAYERRITLPQGDPGKFGLEEFIYLQGDWGATRVQ